MQWLYTQPAYLIACPWWGWGLLVLWLAGLMVAAYLTRPLESRRGQWKIFVALLALTLLLTPISLRGLGKPLHLPTPMATGEIPFTPLAAIGWMLAAGLLGAPASMVLAFLSGLIVALWGNHLPTTPFVEATLAWVFSFAYWQPYKGRVYRLLRQPLGALVPLPIILFFLQPTAALIPSHTPLTVRLDFVTAYAVTFIFYEFAALVVAALIAQGVAFWHPEGWGHRGPLRPSPVVRSLGRQFSAVMVGLMTVVALSILVGNWLMAQRTAQRLLFTQLDNNITIAKRNVPLFTEQGEQLIRDFAQDPRLRNTSKEKLTQVLHQLTTQSFFFTALLLTDAQGKVQAAYSPFPRAKSPSPSTQGQEPSRLDPNEVQNLIRFLRESHFPSYHCAVTLPEANLTLVAFAAPLPQTSNQNLSQEPRFLIGHADLRQSPGAKIITTALDNLRDEKNGTVLSGAVILDQEGRILYATSPNLGWLQESAPLAIQNHQDTITNFFGQRYLFRSAQIPSDPWHIAAAVSTATLQSIVLKNTWPLTLSVVLLTLLELGAIHGLLTASTRSLHTLTRAAQRIAQGHLDQPVTLASEDEIGQLARALEHMRQRLQDRIQELNRLLHTSQRVAASLDAEKAAWAVLGAALTKGAAAARIVLSPEALPDDHADDYPTRFGRGAIAEQYRALDDILLATARKQHIIRIDHYPPATPNFPNLPTRPRALLAVGLHYERRFLGVLFVVYTTPHLFTDEEMRYLNTLGFQMAMAAYTARLYFMAEVRRQRLLAVLNASPDPILVTDQQEHLILANKAALEHRLIQEPLNRPLEEVIAAPELVTLLRREESLPFSEEVNLGKRVYFATVAGVDAQQPLGRVCILRDITQFKELDALKSEFVATVSHDLRKPLTLVKGYAEMLDLVGELNERQKTYVAQIRQSALDMSQLVDNLLDLGRIEAGVGLQVQLMPVLDALEEVVRHWQPQAKQKNIALHTDIAPDMPLLIEADPMLFSRMLHNLLDNAIKYTPEGGEIIVIGRAAQNGNLVLAVKDNGIGIAPIDQQRLFEKFFQVVQRGQPKNKGTGLGLAIVKSIVERHHGRIWVESQLGKGSTFYVELPLRQPKQAS